MNIGIVGNQLAGKTTIANLIQKNLAILGVPSFVLKLADPLYESANYFNKINGNNSKQRLFLQQYSDLIKSHFGNNILLKIFFLKASKMGKMGALVCDDIRLSEELDVFKKEQWFTIFVKADEDVRRQRAIKNNIPYIDNHITETQVSMLSDKCDLVIDNNNVSLNTLEQIIINFIVEDFFQVSKKILEDYL